MPSPWRLAQYGWDGSMKAEDGTHRTGEGLGTGTSTGSSRNTPSQQAEPGGRFAALRLLDGTTLKLIALVTMLIDHVGAALFPGAVWMRAVGRIAMPIFAFCVAEGYTHTSDRRRYLLRLGVFAAVSELPFDFALMGGPELTHQNIMLTFAIAVATLMAADALMERFEGSVGIVAGLGAVLAGSIVAVFLKTDYNYLGVMLVALFHFLKESEPPVKAAVGGAYYLFMRNMGYLVWGVVGFALTAFYNGKRGRGLKYLFYLFYPGHLALIALIGHAIGS